MCLFLCWFEKKYSTYILKKFFLSNNNNNSERSDDLSFFIILREDKCIIIEKVCVWSTSDCNWKVESLEYEHLLYSISY